MKTLYKTGASDVYCPRLSHLKRMVPNFSATLALKSKTRHTSKMHGENMKNHAITWWRMPAMNAPAVSFYASFWNEKIEKHSRRSNAVEKRCKPQHHCHCLRQISRRMRRLSFICKTSPASTALALSFRAWPKLLFYIAKPMDFFLLLTLAQCKICQVLQHHQANFKEICQCPGSFLNDHV